MHIVAGTFKNKGIATPKGSETRPTAARLREALFNICQSYIQDATFLDLFAGSGAMGLEALSRGAKSASFVDSSRECVRCIQDNLKGFNLETQAQVLHGDVFEQIEKLAKRGKSFNIIYADPPYEKWETINGKELSYSMRLLQIIDSGSLLGANGTLFIEEAEGAQPDVEGLMTLKLVSSRRLGRSVLQQFEKIVISGK